MKSNRMSIFILFFIALLTACFSLYISAENSTAQKPIKNKPVTIPLRFDYYYTYDMIVEAVEKLHQAYPQITELDLVGKSEEGRSIYCLVVNNPKTGKRHEKPGIYVDGNIHGNEIQASEVALYLADYLLGSYGKDKELTTLVDKKCFYIIPTVNPDGRYHFFEDGNDSSSSRSIRVPRDDDRDGLVDEDFPQDLDGDGNICRMRKRDPNGKFKADPEDPRILIPVKPGEKGEWTIVGDEGIDRDGDGKIGEDSEGYLDGNRNWGFDWQPTYVESGAGNYPFEAIGIKAIATYIRQQPNICVAWAFHNFGGMYLRGPSAKALGEYPKKDIDVYDILGYQAERITPGYRYMLSWKDLYTTYGDFIEWMANVNGVYGFVGELSNASAESFKTLSENKSAATDPSYKSDNDDFGGMSRVNSEREREHLKYNDNLAQGSMFVDWHPFKHPVYGDIEIGGWVKFSNRIPFPFGIKDMVHRNASAVIFSAKQTPEISMDVFDIKGIGNNLYRVRVRLTNSKAIPSVSYIAQKYNLYSLDFLTANGKNCKVVAGGKIEDAYIDKVSFKEFKPEIQFLFVPGNDKIEYQFIIAGSGSVDIAYSSLHAGKIIKSIQLH